MAPNEDKENEKKPGLIELDKIDDLIHLIASTPLQFLDHIELAGKHYYFIVLGGFPGFSHLIYYIARDDPINKKYIIYDSLADTFRFGNELERRGGIICLSIINIKKTNILTVEDFDVK